MILWFYNTSEQGYRSHRYTFPPQMSMRLCKKPNEKKPQKRVDKSETDTDANEEEDD